MNTAMNTAPPLTQTATRTFIGLGQHTGWRFTLGHQTSECGLPGFMRRQLRPADERVAELERIDPINELQRPGYTAEMRKLVLNPEPTWIEEQWLTEWLRRGLVKEVPS